MRKWNKEIAIQELSKRLKNKIRKEQARNIKELYELKLTDKYDELFEREFIEELIRDALYRRESIWQGLVDRGHVGLIGNYIDDVYNELFIDHCSIDVSISVSI